MSRAALIMVWARHATMHAATAETPAIGCHRCRHPRACVRTECLMGSVCMLMPFCTPGNCNRELGTCECQLGYTGDKGFGCIYFCFGILCAATHTCSKSIHVCDGMTTNEMTAVLWHTRLACRAYVPGAHAGCLSCVRQTRCSCEGRVRAEGGILEPGRRPVGIIAVTCRPCTVCQQLSTASLETYLTPAHYRRQ